jgi:hypothetical protein
VPPNTSVAGVVEAGDVDHFAVALKKGQRLAAEVEGVRMGGELNDTALAVFGPDGKEIAAADDTPLFRQDPFVTAVAPADGTYVVQVRDTNFGGGDNHRYVLHVGTFSRPAAVFPAGGPAGTEVAVKFFGPGEERTANVKLPALQPRDLSPAKPGFTAAPGAPFELYPADAGGTAPTPNPFRVSPFPNVVETEPNDDPKQAGTAAAWPVAFNGIVEKAGDADHFRFRAKRGDAIDVQAWAFRVGSPLDTVVAVLDSRGELVAANDDDETHDSRLQVIIPDDGEYVVRVTDKRKQGGPAFIYRVELDAPKPGRGRVPRGAEPQVAGPACHYGAPRQPGDRVPRRPARRGGRAGHARDGRAARRGDGGAAPIPAGEYLLPVVFEAAADAPLGGRLVELTGTAGGANAHGGGRVSHRRSCWSAGRATPRCTRSRSGSSRWWSSTRRR